MIGPNLSNFRPVVSANDPTMAAPGFFDQAIFPVFSSAGLDGSLPILPMEPLNLPGIPGLPAASGGAATGQTKGLGFDKSSGLPLLSMDVQKDYLNGIIASFMQSSRELQSGFAQFLGGGVRT